MLAIVCSLYAQLFLAQPPRLPSTGTYSRNFTEVFAANRNPAAWAGLKKYRAGIYTERRFMLKEMSGHALNAAIPLSPGTLGIRCWEYGFSLYKEQLFSLGYARPLVKGLSAGIHLNYGTQRAAGYKANNVMGELGILWQVAERLGVGAHIDGMKLYTIGMGYEPSAQVLIEAEWKKEEGKPLATIIDGIYRPIKRCWLLGGFATQPVYQFAGIGFLLRNIQISITGSRHQILGITPGISLVWADE